MMNNIQFNKYKFTHPNNIKFLDLHQQIDQNVKAVYIPNCLSGKLKGTFSLLMPTLKHDHKPIDIACAM